MNNYKKILNSIQVPEMGPLQNLIVDIDLGLNQQTGDRELAPGQATVAEDIYFTSGGIQKDIGWSNVGLAASSRIIGLGFQGFPSEVGLVYRFFFNGAPNIQLQFYAASWINTTGVTPQGTRLGLLSSNSILNAADTKVYLVFAHGGPLYKVDNLNVVSAIGGSPPANAMSLFAFAGRLIALQADLDPNAIAWTVLGNIEDWVGAGSGILISHDSYGTDGSDYITGAGDISNQMFALFRRRNINKCFLTGNATQAIGVVSGIEGLGTDHPATIVEVPGIGLVFAGSDGYIYGLTPGFQLINLSRTLGNIFTKTAPANTASAAYDYHRGEYILSLGFLGVRYILDVGRFLTTQEIIWRTRSASDNSDIYVAADRASLIAGNYYVTDVATNHFMSASSSSVDKAGVAYTGRFKTSSMNRDNKIMTLQALTIYYKTAAFNTMTVTVFGGRTTTPVTKVVNLFGTDATVDAAVTVDFGVTGEDIRILFQLDFPFTAVSLPLITGFNPHLVVRGDVNYG